MFNIRVSYSGHPASILGSQIDYHHSVLWSYSAGKAEHLISHGRVLPNGYALLISRSIV